MNLKLRRFTQSIGCLFAILWLLIPASLSAQSTSSSQELDSSKWARGYNGFALVCRSLGMDFATNESNWKSHPADERILIQFGGRRSQRRVRRFSECLAGGGAFFHASDNGQSLFNDIQFLPGPMEVANGSKQFKGYRDCLVVELFARHPITAGVNQVATNKPGGILRTNQSDKRSAWNMLSYLPRVNGQPLDFGLLAATKQDSPGRTLLCADPSMFSNQMLVHLDNARLTLQALNWLSDGKRKHILFVVNGRIVNPDNPQAVDVNLPPPSQEEILDALKNLPPDLLLKVGNEMAALVEDENIVNEVMSLAFESTSKKHLVRGLILLTTILLGGFLFYRYIASENTVQDVTGTDTKSVAGPKRGWLRRRRKAADDRHLVARELVGRFYSKVFAGKHNHYIGFPNDLAFVNCDTELELRRGMQQTAKFLKWKSRSWWTQERLLRLKEQINYWEHLVKHNQLVCVSNSERLAESHQTASSDPNELERN